MPMQPSCSQYTAFLQRPGTCGRLRALGRSQPAPPHSFLPIFHLGSPRKTDPTKCQVSFGKLRKKLFFGGLGGARFPGPSKVANCHSFPSPAAVAPATLNEKTQCFALRHPSQHESHATFVQPLQCPKVTTSLSHPTYLRYVTTSLSHHFPKSPLQKVTTLVRHHFPKSPLP